MLPVRRDDDTLRLLYLYVFQQLSYRRKHLVTRREAGVSELAPGLQALALVIEGVGDELVRLDPVSLKGPVSIRPLAPSFIHALAQPTAVEADDEPVACRAHLAQWRVLTGLIEPVMERMLGQRGGCIELFEPGTLS